MPVQFTKPKPNPETQKRVAEVMRALDEAARAIAPAVQRVGIEMGESIRRSARRPA